MSSYILFYSFSAVNSNSPLQLRKYGFHDFLCPSRHVHVGACVLVRHLLPVGKECPEADASTPSFHADRPGPYPRCEACSAQVSYI